MLLGLCRPAAYRPSRLHGRNDSMVPKSDKSGRGESGRLAMPLRTRFLEPRSPCYHEYKEGSEDV